MERGRWRERMVKGEWRAIRKEGSEREREGGRGKERGRRKEGGKDGRKEGGKEDGKEGWDSREERKDEWRRKDSEGRDTLIVTKRVKQRTSADSLHKADVSK